MHGMAYNHLFHCTIWLKDFTNCLINGQYESSMVARGSMCKYLVMTSELVTSYSTFRSPRRGFKCGTGARVRPTPGALPFVVQILILDLISFPSLW